MQSAAASRGLERRALAILALEGKFQDFVLSVGAWEGSGLGFRSSAHLRVLIERVHCSSFVH